MTYRNTSSNPTGTSRNFTFTVASQGGNVDAALRGLAIVAIDNAPDVDNSSGALAYTENDPATPIDTSISVSDVDSASLTGATVQITGNLASAEDELVFANAGGITGTFAAVTGTLTLQGTATVAAYEAALESVSYRNSSDSPSTAMRTVTYTLRDATGFGTPDTHGVTVAAVDDPPTAVDDAATVSEDSSATAIAVRANDTDVDAGPRSVGSVTQPTNGTVTITGGGTGLSYAPNANYCNSPPGYVACHLHERSPRADRPATSARRDLHADERAVAVNDSRRSAKTRGDGDQPCLPMTRGCSDSGRKSVASVTQPANGAVAITGGGTGVSYTPNPNYCNNPPGSTPDTFSYTLNGGSSATVSATVTCADDAPSAVADSATVGEDAGATTVPVLTNDTDVDGGPRTIASATDPANGTVVLTGGSPGAHTGLTYQPDPNHCGSDSFTYALNGGSSATVTITVTCANDAPVVDTSAGATSFTENGAPVPVDSGVTVTDVDSAIQSATVAITAGFAAGDVLALNGSHPGIAASFSAGTLTLTGPASASAFQAALRAVTFVNASENPATAARTMTFTVTDASSDQSSDTKSLTVAASDDAPSAVADSATVGEDAGATTVPVLTNDTDVDGGPRTIASATNPANGTVVLTGGSPGAHTGLTYQPDPNHCGSDSFTYALNGGSSATVTITVTCADDAPVAVNDSATLAEDAGATAVTVLANDTDVDGGPISIASVTQPANGDAVITGGGTGVSYTPDAGLLQLAERRHADTFSYTLEPGSSSATVSITVTCADIAPTAVDDAATVAEDCGATTIDVLANDTDPDGGPKSACLGHPAGQRHRGDHQRGTDLSYTPNANYCNSPPGTAPDTFTYTWVTAATTATVSVTVTCVDDPPVAVNDSRPSTRTLRRRQYRVLSQRHRHRRRPEDDRVGERPRQRNGRADRRLARRPHRPDLPARPELLRRGLVHVHRQRRLTGHRLDDRQLPERCA